jgi:hypothetical protein
MWRTLQLRTFIDEFHTLTPWGHGFAKGLEKLPNEPLLQASLYLLLELLRFKALNHEDLSVKYTGGPMHVSGRTLLSRV